MECIITGCTNSKLQGEMHGSLCMPCYKYLLAKYMELKNTIEYSQAYRNDLNACIAFLEVADIEATREKWKKERV